MKRALVLGGGGVVGVAWETALVTGLLERGVDLREADLIVGTSAGSMVGSRLAAGQDLRAPLGESLGGMPIPADGPDLPKLREIFGRWSSIETVTPQFCKEIGSLALAANTAAEADWIQATGGSLGVADWPETALRISGVDAATGERALWSGESGVPFASAVAASCSVPGMFPPITIGTERYVDGGVWSGTNADAVIESSPELVVVIAPITEGTASFGALADRSLQAEAAACEAAGANVVVVVPGAAEKAAFGPDLMSPAAAADAAAAGLARGHELAAGELAAWTAP
jgi:NTE family protein